MTARIGLARYSAKEALRIILDESDDSTDNDNDSVSENDDHVSEYSEHSDVESADDEVDIGAQCLPAPANSGQNSRPISVGTRGRGRGLRGRGVGRQQGVAVQAKSASGHLMTGKNGFVWETQPPA